MMVLMACCHGITLYKMRCKTNKSWTRNWNQNHWQWQNSSVNMKETLSFLRVLSICVYAHLWAHVTCEFTSSMLLFITCFWITARCVLMRFYCICVPSSASSGDEHLGISKTMQMSSSVIEKSSCSILWHNTGRVIKLFQKQGVSQTVHGCSTNCLLTVSEAPLL